MFNLIKNELIKIFHMKKIYVYMLVIFAFTLLPKLEVLIGEVNFIINGQNLPLYMLVTIMGTLMPLFIIILIADLVTEEYTNGTLKLTLIHPVSRQQLLTAKLLTLTVPMVILAVYSILVSYVVGTAFFGWGSDFIYNDVSYPLVSGILLTLGSYLITILPLLAFAAVILLLALNLSSSGATVGISIGLLMVFSFVAQLIEWLQPYVIITYFVKLPEYILFETNISKIVMALGVLIIYGLGSYLFSILLFKRKYLVY